VEIRAIFNFLVFMDLKRFKVQGSRFIASGINGKNSRVR
jgi:hypothetical protein